ncbi:hypothetical protein KQX54_019753 [Cotesia glomerata]|uniref:Uncharacterized protein n=1 Tax=Cotesia glomerata TaxID=32391 RepID=A0AAV7J0T0_COTGL|nr:hypothetical protein KQX54_019753 [Cotesia glomerata]
MTETNSSFAQGWGSRSTTRATGGLKGEKGASSNELYLSDSSPGDRGEKTKNLKRGREIKSQEYKTVGALVMLNGTYGVSCKNFMFTTRGDTHPRGTTEDYRSSSGCVARRITAVLFTEWKADQGMKVGG